MLLTTSDEVKMIYKVSLEYDFKGLNDKINSMCNVFSNIPIFMAICTIESWKKRESKHSSA